jgi:hypothetical protein
MTPERFQTIVAAYGADPRRWPSAERPDALAWAELHPAEADAALAESAGLDAWLSDHKVAPPERAFIERVVATAPVREPPRQRARFWWQGAAFAGIGLAGGLAGAFAVSFFVLTTTAPVGHEASYTTSSFGGSTADWSGE